MLIRMVLGNLAERHAQRAVDQLCGEADQREDQERRRIRKNFLEDEAAPALFIATFAVSSKRRKQLRETSTRSVFQLRQLGLKLDLVEETRIEAASASSPTWTPSKRGILRRVRAGKCCCIRA